MQKIYSGRGSGQCNEMFDKIKRQEKVIIMHPRREKEVYILASNYLQSLDWMNDASILKIYFNSIYRPRLYDRLLYFYNSWSQLEIDEFRDYNRALDVLRKAEEVLCLEKLIDEEKSFQLRRHIKIVDQFLQARSYIDSDEEQMVT
eukprot:UN02795